MVWTPGNNRAICGPKPCNAEMLIFLQFLTQYLGVSYDNQFQNIRSGDNSTEFDFIIVGGGAAGCVVANRLSEIKNWNVLLLESGDEEPLITELPGLISLMPNSSLDYNYTTQPHPNVCNGQPCPCARGRVLGGTSNFYYNQYVRGNKWDYNNWERLGNLGWNWNNVLKYFKKSENMTINNILKNYGKYHGVGGYQTVSEEHFYDENAKIIMDGWKEIGLREIDYNSGINFGTSRLQYTFDEGSRLSANRAFIKSIRKIRKNLTVRVNSVVTKIIIDSQNKEAIGVEYKSVGSNKTKRIFAKKEVILSAGSIDSPKLLMLSGIGPYDNLRKSGVNVIQNLPVGKNLQNHVGIIPFIVKITRKPEPFSIKKAYKDIFRWLKHRSGPMSISSIMDNVAFFNTSFEKQKLVPDIQIVYVKSQYDNDFKSDRILFPYYDGYRVATILLTSKSRGYITLNISNPSGDPLIYPEYFSDPMDIPTLAEGARLTKKLLETEAFKKAGYQILKVHAPLCDNLPDDSLRYYECLAKKYTGVTHHLVGTCKMGPQFEDDTVVDPRLKVKGIKKLRVIDASIMPVIPRGNAYAPTIMIAEKGSDMIKEDWSL